MVLVLVLKVSDPREPLHPGQKGSGGHPGHSRAWMTTSPLPPCQEVCSGCAAFAPAKMTRGQLTGLLPHVRRVPSRPWLENGEAFPSGYGPGGVALPPRPPPKAQSAWPSALISATGVVGGCPESWSRVGYLPRKSSLPSKWGLEEGLGAEQEGRYCCEGASSGKPMGLAFHSALWSGSCLLFSGSHQGNGRRLSTSSLPGRALGAFLCWYHRILMVPCEPSLLPPLQAEKTRTQGQWKLASGTHS